MTLSFYMIELKGEYFILGCVFMEKYARFKYMPCLPLGEDGRRITASKKHTSLSRKAANEGMVLLKNDNKTLPLSKDSKVHNTYFQSKLLFPFFLYHLF